MSAFLHKLNTKMLTVAFVLSVIAMPALADVPVPTLDRVKSEQSAFLDTDYSTYSLTEVTADVTAPEGAITVNIGGKEYFYTPTDNKDVLQLLSATGSIALIETTQDKALYTTPDGKYYTYDSSKLKDSAYTLTEAASADEPNTITLYDKNADGTVTAKYYTVSLKQTEYGDKTEQNAKPMYFKWVDVDGNKQLTQDDANADNYDIVYYAKTEYGNPNGDTTLTFRWEKNADTGNLEFKQNPATPVGQTITYKYNSSDVQTRFTNSTDNSSKTTTGAFVKQSSTSDGGAIYNNGSNAKLGDINSDFIGNYAQSGSSNAYGGAIYNSGTIGNITGDFIGNYAQSDSRYAYGGAIYNDTYDGTATIENITGDFIGNYAQSGGTNHSAYGGAIYNHLGTIGDITGDFIGNYAQGLYVSGGAIYNYNNSTIGNITGDFIGNYAQASSYAYGGAIYNEGGTIGNITGDFIGNYAQADSSYTKGGAIYNDWGTIGNITGDFIGNYAYVGSGGAIYNTYDTIGNITGDFIGNYAQGSSYAHGGAIYNTYGTIGNITGDFIGNYAKGSYNASGGAIYNTYDTIGNITGDFIGNYALSAGTGSASANGGAIYNDSATIESIIGDFIGNYAQSYNQVYGGAIYNQEGTIGDITGDFIGNYAQSNSSLVFGG